jgi:hypothetical protein
MKKKRKKSKNITILKEKDIKNCHNMQIITCIHGEDFQHRLSALPMYGLTCIPFHQLEKNEMKIKN